MYGTKISSIRLARGYTQEYMAKKIGIEQTTYSKIEKDMNAKIKDELVEKIATTLGVSVDDIKSPTPIIMSFGNNSQGVIFETQNAFGPDKELISHIIKLLDSFQMQIANQNMLLELLLKKNKK